MALIQLPLPFVQMGVDSLTHSVLYSFLLCSFGHLLSS